MDYSIQMTLAPKVGSEGIGVMRLPHRLLQEEPGRPLLHRLFSQILGHLLDGVPEGCWELRAYKAKYISL